MFCIAKKLTRRVALRHDYMPFEFCLFLYKDDSKNKKNVFNEHYKFLLKSFKNDDWLKKNYHKKIFTIT